jgi:hypothetical protein
MPKYYKAEELQNRLREILNRFDNDNKSVVVKHPLNDDYFFLRIEIFDNHFKNQFAITGNYKDISNYIDGLLTGLTIAVKYSKDLINLNER